MTAEQFKAERAGGKEIMRLGSSETEGMQLMHSDVFVQRGIHFRFGCRWRHRDQPMSGVGWTAEGGIRSK